MTISWSVMRAEEQWYLQKLSLTLKFQDLITYQIMSRYPFDIQECTEGMGAACGSTYLVDGFEDLLRKKLGRHGTKILTEKELMGARRYFELSIKCQFNPYDVFGDQAWEIL